MTLIKDVTDCSTYSVHGLDVQIIAQMNVIHPNLLARIDDLNVELGQSVHPWLIAPAKSSLAKALELRGQKMTINSAFRTIAGQALLRSHYENRRCSITAAAPPGRSNHNGASAIDIEDSEGWRGILNSCGWKWLGSFDPMHYDHTAGDLESINTIAVRAFQQLWNLANPFDLLCADGDFGPATMSRLLHSPAEGFPVVKPSRILRFTQPLQMGTDVGLLQLALRKAGIAIEKADQVFGAGTDIAVKAFQSANNLGADGIVCDRTRKLLGLAVD
jgi:N-acetylmuramoyl-L-alanine amidase